MRNLPVTLFLLALLALTNCQPTSRMNQEKTPTFTNSLINETSPYLLQHAHNPVEWYPWGEEAMAKAKEENKLLLISVGYSACHWCHVMERESFEDTTVANLMNKYFINVKVDREERPDVDQVYMNAVQLMTGSGGWPLNCMALPDGRPIYGGTYFPKDKWMSVLESLQRLKETDPEKLEEYAANLTAGVQQSELVHKSLDKNEISSELISQKVKDWAEYWDLKKGGPNRAPKFPLPNNYQFLLEYSFLTKDKKAEDYVMTSLDEISHGGIFDQIGGGFARYSTDSDWKVPHFEKMLYDNAQLVSLYCQAFSATKNQDYKNTVYKTLSFIERELTAPSGGFYSALDADSEGEEGKYYVWTKEELTDVLTVEEYDLVSEYYNVNAKGLWEHGNYILLRDKKSNRLADETSDFYSKLEQITEKLLQKREERIKPGLDDKILTSWNAMMVEGYVDAYLSFTDISFLDKAKKQMNFLLSALQTSDGGLFHKHKEGKSSINGYLEDYAFTISVLIKLYEATLDEKWLTEAKSLSNYSLDHFYDDNSGMFWYKSDLDPALIARKQENTDNVIPASNSMMAHNLFKLSKLLYNEHFEKTSIQMLNNIMPHADFAQSYSNWLRLALYQTSPFYEIAITGSGAESLRKKLSAEYIPNKILLGSETPSTLPLLKDKFMDIGTIFVCQNKTCQLPVNTIEDALKQVNR